MSATPASVKELWPGSRVTRRPGRRPALLVLPSARRPRLLVPTGLPAARVMLKRHSTSRVQTLGQAALAAGVRTGLLALLPVARLVDDGSVPTIEAHVRTYVPGADRVGVLLGPPRANAKPVLQVFAADGRTVAFGKVGHDLAAAVLVRREADVLADPRLHLLEHVEVPEVLSDEPFDGLPVLLMSPMSAAQSRAGSWELPLDATVEVAESGGVTWGPLAASSYWADLGSRAEGLADGGERRLADLLTQVAPLTAASSLGYGRWHGDWSPWNMGRSGDQVQVWDWEQSRDGVPLGLDAVHFVLQREFRHGTPAAATADALVAEATTALSRWYGSPEQVEATVLLYVLEITHRYLTQAAAGATAQLTLRLARLEELAALLVERRRATLGAGEPATGPDRRTPSGWST